MRVTRQIEAPLGKLSNQLLIEFIMKLCSLLLDNSSSNQDKTLRELIIKLNKPRDRGRLNTKVESQVTISGVQSEFNQDTRMTLV
jgi:hypothetical protein